MNRRLRPFAREGKSALNTRPLDLAVSFLDNDRGLDILRDLGVHRLHVIQDGDKILKHDNLAPLKRKVSTPLRLPLVGARIAEAAAMRTLDSGSWPSAQCVQFRQVRLAGALRR